MKKLLSFFGIISIMGGSFAPLVAWKTQFINRDILQSTINEKKTSYSKNYMLKDYAPVNDFQENPFGILVGDLKRSFYLKFYITPEFYNYFNLILKETYLHPDLRHLFYDNFIGSSAGTYPVWQHQVVDKFLLKISSLNAIYNFDFNNLLKNFFSDSGTYSFFYNLFTGQYNENNLDPYHPPSEENYFRESGVILEFAIVPGHKSETTWVVNKINTRVMAQNPANELLSHYYYIFKHSASGKYDIKEAPKIFVDVHKSVAESILVMHCIDSIKEALKNQFFLPTNLLSSLSISSSDNLKPIWLAVLKKDCIINLIFNNPETQEFIRKLPVNLLGLW